VELISHPALAELHPTYGHPESTERLEALLLAFPEAREASPATEDDVHRCHSLRVLELLRSLDRPAYIERTYIFFEKALRDPEPITEPLRAPLLN